MEIGADPRVDVSVIISTYNRPEGLKSLIGDLSNQDLANYTAELIIVDDGSHPPVPDKIITFAGAIDTKLIHQENMGPGVARQNGIKESGGELIVLIDDDMRVGKDYIRTHVRALEDSDVVIGRIVAPDRQDSLSLFERFHLYQFQRWCEAFKNGKKVIRGVHLSSGNVSFKKDCFMSVGGFDIHLEQSEDRDLGIRFDLAGKKIVYSSEAQSTHVSTHVEMERWLEKVFNYGVWDRKISEKYPGEDLASPWSLINASNRIYRPILLACVYIPGLAVFTRKILFALCMFLDGIGAGKIAVRICSLLRSIEYLRGVISTFSSYKEAIYSVRSIVNSRRD